MERQFLGDVAGEVAGEVAGDVAGDSLVAPPDGEMLRPRHATPDTLGSQASQIVQPTQYAEQQQRENQQQIPWRDTVQVQNDLELLVEMTLDAMPPIEQLVARLPRQMLSLALGPNP